MVEESGAVAYLLQTLIIQALALQLAGCREEAIESMKRLLILGENGGYIWVFVRTGQPMELLLRSTIERKGSMPYIEELLNAFDRLRAVDESEIREHPDLPDPLTARELEVLTLLNSDFSIPEIAATLVISPATLRTHIKRIYRKLDVHSRFEAVTRARERQLTEGSPTET